jgi:hypothetical protein
MSKMYFFVVFYVQQITSPWLQNGLLMASFLPSLAMSLNTPPADIEIYLSLDKNIYKK